MLGGLDCGSMDLNMGLWRYSFDQETIDRTNIDACSTVPQPPASKIDTFVWRVVAAAQTSDMQ